MSSHFPRWLSKFLGIHSFLIGIFPFFIPVFLWNMGLSLSHISFFIALTGVGFLVSLWFWDRAHKKIHFSHLITVSFLLEVLVLTMVFFAEHIFFLFLLGLLNGAYNCFFWVTQRAMFFETVSPENSGKKLGNFQILVFLVLKIGIFMGAFLLEHIGYWSVFVFSCFVSVLGVIWFLSEKKRPELPKVLTTSSPVSFTQIYTFRDRLGSRLSFLLDGPFLFCESFFWTISLFLITHESFVNLGMVVILLAVLFSGIFLLIKNKIDALDAQKVYCGGVLLYSLSWILRAIAPEIQGFQFLSILLFLIAFCTSFFRLTFNKRFFDVAHHTSAHQYLFLKSYYSQFCVVIVFSLLGIVFMQIQDQVFALQISYLCMGALALFYGLYRQEYTQLRK